MARPTKNRRSTKHRGNAAGMIEARGRTGRKPSASEKGSGAGKGVRGASGSARKKRFESPPTWKSAAIRAVIAAAVVYLASTLLIHQTATRNLVIVPLVLGIYTPMIYYTDLYIYRRAQRKKSAR